MGVDMQYRREIDGLRAVAVVPVILFHAGFTVFSGGYVGVDVFFVISGYLITAILIAEREAGAYSLWRFYERRARRILPALFLVLAFCIPFAWLGMPPYIFEDFARSIAFAALFVSNVHFWENVGYFALDAELQPLLHTWSLAVEEQFYLLFPLILMMLGRFRRQRFTIIFGVLLVLSLALSEWGWRTYPEENFFFTFSRFWELLAGSICAVWLRERDFYPNEILAALGLGFIVFSIVFFDDLLPFPSLYTLLPVLGTMFIILFAAPQTAIAKLLSVGPLVGIGLISYSAYLWHQPLFAFARLWSAQEPGHVLMAGLAGLSLVLAYFTWRFVEQPFRRKPIPLLSGRSALFGASLAGISVFVGFGFWGYVSDGFKGRIERAMTADFKDVIASFEERSDYSNCVPGSDGATRGARLCVMYQPDDPQQVFGVIGDSHAFSLIAGLEPVAEQHNATILAAAVPACPPLIGVDTVNPFHDSGFCKQAVQAQIDEIIKREVDLVFLVGRWSLYATDGYDKPDPEFALSIDGQPVARDPDTALKALKIGLEKTTRTLTNAGIKVVLIAQVPAQKVLPQQVFERTMMLDLPSGEAIARIEESFIDAPSHFALQARANSALRAQESDMVTVIQLDEAFAVGDRFTWFSDGKALYIDQDHLSVSGALIAGTYLAEKLDQILNPE